MATNANQFVVNIVELQNIATSITGVASGAAALTQLQSDVANLQQMVKYDTKTIAADVLSNYTTSHDIQVLANLNLSNTTLYYNSNSVTESVSNTSSISTLTFSTYISTSVSSIQFIVAGDTPLQITSTGMLKYTSSPTYFSTGVDIAGWLYVSESAYVKNLYQTSDKHLKTNITPFFTTVNDVLRLEPRHFNWKNTGDPDIGFIAQEVSEVWPTLTNTDSRGSMGIAYSRFIPLLLESIRELNKRVTDLENSGLKN
jgi:hypothetical protein